MQNSIDFSDNCTSQYVSSTYRVQSKVHLLPLAKLVILRSKGEPEAHNVFATFGQSRNIKSILGSIFFFTLSEEEAALPDAAAAVVGDGGGEGAQPRLRETACCHRSYLKRIF